MLFNLLIDFNVYTKEKLKLQILLVVGKIN